MFKTDWSMYKTPFLKALLADKEKEVIHIRQHEYLLESVKDDLIFSIDQDIEQIITILKERGEFNE